MRQSIVVAASAALLLAACGPPKFIPPSGLSARQEAVDRTYCQKVGEASRKDPKMHEFVEQQVGAHMIGSAIGGGLIGLATAAAMQDQVRENWRKNWVMMHGLQCLQKKGYKQEGA